MNPQYMNQGPPGYGQPPQGYGQPQQQGFGGPPAGGMMGQGPPQQPGMYNGVQQQTGKFKLCSYNNCSTKLMHYKISTGSHFKLSFQKEVCIL